MVTNVNLNSIVTLKSVFGCDSIKTAKELKKLIYRNESLDYHVITELGHYPSLTKLGFKLNELVTGPDCQVYEKSLIMVQHTDKGFRYTDKRLSPNFDVGLLIWEEVTTMSEVVNLMVEFYTNYLGPNYLHFR